MTLNYQNVSNPTCQIWSNALSADTKYGGLITIWRDYKTIKELAENIIIEVGVFDIQNTKRVSLDAKPVHQFGNDSGIVTGISRDQEGFLLFVVDKVNFKKMIDPSNQLFMTIAKDKVGNEIAIGAPLEGIKEACAECGFFD